MSPGQTGHITGQMGRVPGTDGTHTRGCPAKILYVYWFFSFRKEAEGDMKTQGVKMTKKEKTTKCLNMKSTHLKGGCLLGASFAVRLGVSLTAGFLYRAGAETPLNFREKFRVFPRTILENFSGVDTQTAVLVSRVEVWISAPDTQTPIFLGFLGIHS